MLAFLAIEIVVGIFTAWVILSPLVASVKAFKLRIPGPLLCKLSPWTLRWHDYKGDREEWVQTLHEKHGDVVILSPLEISVVSADALREVYVSRKLDKPESATVILEQFGESNLVTTQEVGLHARRRRIVAPAYVAPTIVSEPSQRIFRRLVNKFCDQIEKEMVASPDGSCDVWPLARFLATDIMTNVVFGEEDALNSLEDPAHRHIVRMVLVPIDETRATVGVLLMQWYPRLMHHLLRSKLYPQSLRGWGGTDGGLHGYVMEKVKKALDRSETKKASVPSHVDLLVSKYREGTAGDCIPNYKWIASDCIDHLFAGSLTSADTMSYMIFEMCQPHNYSRQLKLRQELWDAGIKPATEVPLSSIARLPYLHCVIRETLRAYPPIPFAQPRLIRPGQELQVDGYHIPAGTTVSAQHYSVQRRACVYPNPERWDPERWEVPQDSDEHREMMRHFWPFGSGQRMCVGQHIAWAEVRLAAAKIFSGFEVSFGREYLRKEGILLPEARRRHLFPFTNVEPIRFKRIP